jgi:hypothetical protein
MKSGAFLSVSRNRPMPSWQSIIWIVNGFFLVMTVVVAYVPGGSSPDRRGVIQYLAQFTFAEERNLATYWEGWCLLLIAVLAFQQFLQGDKTAPRGNRSWLGLSVLAAGLSLDELGSIHEQATVLLESWGLAGSVRSLVPLALPALFVLSITLRGMWTFKNRRAFWLTSGAFVLFGSVAVQEYFEHAVVWPWWAAGIRVGIEEGTELVGVFLLLCGVMRARDSSRGVYVLDLAPRPETLIRLRPAVALVTLATFVPLGMFTNLVVGAAHHRGTPAAWLPFALLNLSATAAWICARRDTIYRSGFCALSLLALFFSLDQIIVFERVIDKGLTHGALAILMFPSLAAACLAIPSLRTPRNFIVLGALLPWSLALVFFSRLLTWLILPLQSLAIFWVLASDRAIGFCAFPNRLSRQQNFCAEPAQNRSD